MQDSCRAIGAIALVGCAVAGVLGPVGCNTSGFKDSYMALDGSGDRKRDVFDTDAEQIYCVAELASGTADVSVIARVRVWAEYDPLTGERRDRAGDVVYALEQAPGVGGNITASFLIERPVGSAFYPAGLYTCDLYLNDDLESSLDFEIVYPVCPFKPVETGDQCAGQVLLGNQCPSPLGGICTCAPDTGLWVCD